MRSDGHVDRSSLSSGIVIVFPPGFTGLFDPDVHRLVKEVEDRLAGVFVTFALSGGANPGVETALNAARFAGCGSAVVVHSEEWLGDLAGIDPSTDTIWEGGRLAADHRETAERVVAAYNQARALSGLAA
jgi:hypothetical protein